MNTNMNSWVAVAALTLAGTGLHAGAICSNSSACDIDTGQLPGVASTASDPFWTIVSAAQGNTSGPAVLIGDPIWSLPLTPTVLANGVHWISTVPSPGDPGGAAYAGGDYIYALSFNAPVSGASYSFKVAVDNAVNVFLNPSAATLTANLSTACTACLLTWGDFGNSSNGGFVSFSPTVSGVTAPAGLNDHAVPGSRKWRTQLHRRRPPRAP